MQTHILFAYYDTAAGLLETGCTADTVCILRFAAGPVHPHQPTALSDRTADEVRSYLAGRLRSFSVPFRIEGTDFQRACYEAARKIPYGGTRTYGQIAEAVGKPHAARAVGAAMARNPVWLLVPCHRVCGSGGSLTGYAGGVECKRRLLLLEQQGIPFTR